MKAEWVTLHKEFTYLLTYFTYLLNQAVQAQENARNLNFGLKKRNCTIRVARTNALISFAVTANLGLCFRICKNPFLDMAGIVR